jgi:hypothetical protein
LNRTNLKGVNGAAKARIEFAYKRKKNDKLENNEISFADDEDVFSDHSEEKVDKKLNRNVSVSNDRSIIKDKKEKINYIKEKFDIINDKNIKKYVDDQDDDGSHSKRKNVCFICKLPGHFAKDCILTKESCYECGEKGHIAKECQGGVREAKILTENRVKAIFSQQSAFKFISVGGRIKNIINYLEKKA